MLRLLPFAMLGTALVASLVGCVPASAAGGAVASTRALIPRDERMAALFDDAISPTVIGLSLAGFAAGSDPALVERTQQAELIARVRVTTLSRDANGQRARYVLTVRIEPNRLVDQGIAAKQLDLVVPEDSPSFSLIDNQESFFRGARFVLFARRFGGQDGPELHWHAVADTEEAARAIGVARDLGISTN
ncbi:MAG: hypothetical protein FJ096_03555 [Deltaproteobacteria bacterium]|nr:hypothetical protein [Deltaproteobacteria bacterium]